MTKPTRTAHLIALILLIPLFAISQRVLVKFGVNRTDVPDGWPVEVSNLTTNTAVLPGWDTNWTMLQVSERIQLLKAAYQAIQDAEEAAKIAARNAKLKLLADLFDDFQTYENGWVAGTNYTSAQMQVILRKHNGALLLMKPILKELYDSRQ